MRSSSSTCFSESLYDLEKHVQKHSMVIPRVCINPTGPMQPTGFYPSTHLWISDKITPLVSGTKALQWYVYKSLSTIQQHLPRSPVDSYSVTYLKIIAFLLKSKTER